MFRVKQHLIPHSVPPMSVHLDFAMFLTSRTSAGTSSGSSDARRPRLNQLLSQDRGRQEGWECAKMLTAVCVELRVALPAL